MKPLFKSLAHYLRPYWVSVAFIFFAISAQMTFRLAMPFGFQLTFDHVIPRRDWSFFIQILSVLGAGWLIQAGLALVQDARAAKVGIAAVNNLRRDMFDHLQRLPIDTLARGRSGDLMSRFSVDLLAIESAATHSVYVFFFSCVNVLASLALLVYFEWRLALMALAGLLLGAMAPKRLSGRAERKSYERKSQEGGLSAFVQETLGTVDMIHAFNLWPSKQEEFDRKLKAFEAKARASYFLSVFVGRLGGQSAALLQVLILALGGFLVIEGSLTMGALVGFLALLQNMVAGASHLAGVLPDLIQASGAMRRVREFFREVETTGQEEAEGVLPRLAESLCFEDVGFGYGDGNLVLDRLRFSIQRGESVAVVGPSGSGKSTLLKLLLRFYEPREGAIRWDGADVRHFSKASLRKQMSIVPQDSVLFDASLRENIRMGRLDASDAEIISASKNAELHDYIRQLPQGYDTRVGERGSRLSGGQRQRVAIARALLRDPALLILDEATSALDPATERAVHETLMNVSRDRTLVSVTHRLNTVTKMDRILVMQQGRLVQQGPHDSLVNQDGAYADLWRKQTGFTISDDGFRAECAPHRLKLIPLFEKLESEELKHLSGLLVSEFFPQNRLVFMKGDPGDKFYMIVNGQVAITDIEMENGQTASAILESGDFFGEMALLDETVRNASANTLMPTLFLSLTQHEFQNLLTEVPRLRDSIEDVVRERRAYPLLER